MNYDNLLREKARFSRFCMPPISLMMLPIVLLAASCLRAQKPAHPEKSTQPGALEWKQVEEAMGRSGAVQADGAIKFAMPRKDLKVVVGGIAVKPGLALGSWAAFKKEQSQAMLMGDLVLSGDEVAPVMARLQDGGVEVTALHNHLLDESPRVMYMHIGGQGDAVKLATALHDALALTKTPGAAPASTAPAEKIGIDVGQIERILGHNGKVNGGILQIAVPRSEKILMHGMQVPPSMGVATGLNFQPTENGRAAIAGDFVLLAREVNPVIQALREHGIGVTGLHSHMLEEQPRLFFMHFWAEGDAVKLAQGLRAALDHTNSAR